MDISAITGLMRFVRVALGLAVALLAGVPGVNAATRTISDASRNPPRPHWRSGPYCGVNATYALLKLLGSGVSYDEIRSRIPVSDSGSSLKDIRHCLQVEGFGAVVVRATPTEMLRSPLPFIAHFERDERQAYSPEHRGHFVVVIRANEDTVRYIDGATATIENRSADSFVRNWSGFLLLPRVASGSGELLRMAGLSIVAVVVIGTVWNCLKTCAPAVVALLPLIRGRRLPK